MMELQILDWIQNMRSPILDKAMVCITSLGNLGAIWVLTAAVLLLRKKSRMHGVLLFIALGVSLIVGNFGIKPLVARMRPFELTGFSGLLIPPPRDCSFPSAHTMTAFASAAVLFSMNRKMGIAAAGLAVLIAFSRLYLYVHFPTDILAGAVLGIGAGWVATHLIAPRMPGFQT